MSSFTVDAKSYALQVALKNGQTVQYEITDISHMTFGNVTGGKMVISSASAAADNIDLSGVAKITFEGDQMVIATADGNVARDFYAIQSITFDLTVNGIDGVKASVDDMVVTVSAGVLSVNASDGTSLDVKVYDLQGHAVASASGRGSVDTDLNALAAGVYIVKVNNKIIKLTR